MYLLLSLMLLVGSNAFAATCTLGEAQEALRTSLQKKLNDGRYDSVADFCIRESQQIDGAVTGLVKNVSYEWGGEYQAVLCEANDKKYNRSAIVVANVFCNGLALNTNRFDQNDRDQSPSTTFAPTKPKSVADRFLFRTIRASSGSPNNSFRAKNHAPT